MDLNSLLNSNGRKMLEKHGPGVTLRYQHFKSDEAYYEYREEQQIGPFRDSLLDGVDPGSIDPKFLKNLCRTLYYMQDQIDDKEDKTTDW